MSDLPAGAIENGRVLIDRLENNYGFECEGGPLRLCTEWDDLKRCFEHLAEYAAAPKPDDELAAKIDGFLLGVKGEGE